MTVLRWILGVVGGLFAAGWIATVLVYVISSDDRFRELGTRLRRMTVTIGLFWFNVEVWGRVIYTVVTWNRPPG
jgi:transposase